MWGFIVMHKTKPHIPENAALVLSLNHEIIEKPIGSDFSSLITNSYLDEVQLNLFEVITAIDKAAYDKHISSLFIQGTVPPTGHTSIAQLKEVREAIERFKASGKPVVAYLSESPRSYYYLGSVANELYMHPLAELPLNGLAAESLFLANTFEKYGIGVQTTRVGKYKSAVETFTQTQFSPENREQLTELLATLWDEYLTDIQKTRTIDQTKLQDAINKKGILTAQVALDLELIDKIDHYDAANKRMESIAGFDKKIKSFNQVNLADYVLQLRDDLEKQTRTSSSKIAVLYADGQIVNGKGTKNQIGGDELAYKIRKLRKDEDIKAIVIRVNSPGGTALGAEKIEHELMLAKQEKPVVVSMGSMAASGGYWISARAHEIICQPTTITGSIGVFILNFNIEKLTNDYGITWDRVKTDPLADMYSAIRPKTPTELNILQELTDNIYDMFIEKVAEGRKLDIAQVKKLAEGRIWSGKAAISNGLADREGGLNTAILKAAELANLEGDWTVSQVESKEPWSGLLELLDGSLAKLSKSNPLLGNYYTYFKAKDILQSFNDHQGIYARIPMDIMIY